MKSTGYLRLNCEDCRKGGYPKVQSLEIILDRMTESSGSISRTMRRFVHEWQAREIRSDIDPLQWSLDQNQEVRLTGGQRK